MNFLKRFWNRLLNESIYPAVQEKLLDEYGAVQLTHDSARFCVFNQIPGDYLEFGVLDGNSFAETYLRLKLHAQSYELHAKQYGHSINPDYFQQKRFFAFDSFQGLPKTESQFAPQHFSNPHTYQASEETFKQSLVRKKIPLSQIKTVPGWFDQTLTPEARTLHALTNACLIFIDCDLYESVVPIFKFISPLIQDGTVLILDDFFRYQGHPGRGIQKAFYDWLDQNPRIQVRELSRTNANRVAFVCHLI